MNNLLTDKIKVYLEACLDKWNNLYKVDKKFDKISLSNATSFLINCLDESINLVENIYLDNKDKKSAVLLISTYLFDKIVVKNLPVYLKPVSYLIRLFVVQILFSVLIDFIVAKYKNGSWNPKKGNEL